MDLRIVGGVLFLAFGLAEAVWAARARARPLVAQGIFFIGLGLSFLIMGVLPEGLARNALSAVVFLGALAALVMQRRLKYTNGVSVSSPTSRS